MTKKVQLLVPRHENGILAERASSPPQIGSLILGAYLKKDNPSLDVEVYDENTSPDRIDAGSLDGDIIGISTWFSNYGSALRIANAVKAARGSASQVIFGGPNVSGIEKRILENHPSVDFVVSGEGEASLKMLVNEANNFSIPGLTYRSRAGIISNSLAQGTNLAEIPNFDLSLLKTSYSWSKGEVPVMSAFPLSGLRGCFRKKRCDWCSINTCGVRTSPAEKYWDQVRVLREKYGINFFFESGDTLLPEFIHELAKNKPKDIPADVKLRGYSHIGFINEEYLRDVKGAGFNNLFFGIESNVVQGKKYSAERMRSDLSSVKRAGLSILPAMILGLPGQDAVSLREDLSFLDRLIDDKSFAPICLLNTPYPFPGSNYFSWCLENKEIRDRYLSITGEDLIKTDRVNIPVLSELFVDAYTPVGFKSVRREISKFMERHPDRVAYWATSAR